MWIPSPGDIEIFLKKYLHFEFLSYVTILYNAFFFREWNQSSHRGHNTTDVFSTSAAVKYYISETY